MRQNIFFPLRSPKLCFLCFSGCQFDKNTIAQLLVLLGVNFPDAVPALPPSKPDTLQLNLQMSLIAHSKLVAALRQALLCALSGLFHSRSQRHNHSHTQDLPPSRNSKRFIAASTVTRFDFRTRAAAASAIGIVPSLYLEKQLAP